jgi:phage shock protein C
MPAYKRKEDAMAVQQANRSRLQRGREDRIFFGVCSGLGRFFDVDPVYFRLAFVLAVLAGGSGILAYLILAIVMPIENATTEGGHSPLRRNLTDLRTEAGQLTRDLGVGTTTDAEGASHLAGRRHPRDVGAAVLIVLGAFFLAANLGWLNWIDFGLLWPLILVALGVALILRHSESA